MIAGEDLSDLSAEIDENIARNLKKAREGASFSQAEFARRMGEIGLRGFHQTTVARVESGKRPLRAAEAIAACRVLGVELESLAESPEDSALRYAEKVLLDGLKRFERGADALLAARHYAARRLDELLPLSSDGTVSDERVLLAGFSADLCARAEHYLNASDPHFALRVIYKQSLDQTVQEPPPNSRLARLYQDLRDVAGVDDGIDQATP